VNYYFDVLDSAGYRERFPKQSPCYATFSFLVGSVEDLFFDDMESGAGDWVHGSYSGDDDWELGAPNPTGQSLYDPTYAHSPSNVWGNSLTGSGVYPRNCTNYLETPEIDCTGKQGVHLRFSRWLSIQQGLYDYAKIFVNDTCIWENPQDQDLIDNKWVLQDFDISALADNNGSVKIRFELFSDNIGQKGGWNIDDVRVYALHPTPILTFLGGTPYPGGLIGFQVHDPNRRNQGVFFFANNRLGTTIIGPPFNIVLDVLPGGIRTLYNALTNSSTVGLNNNGIINIIVPTPFQTGDLVRFQAIAGVMNPSPDLSVSNYVDIQIQ
jgi:hypothetical protein